MKPTITGIHYEMSTVLHRELVCYETSRVRRIVNDRLWLVVISKTPAISHVYRTLRRELG